MSEQYWVVGGEYTDTTFSEIAGDEQEQRHGPFEDYAAARQRWASLSWAGVNDAHTRYRIEKAGAAKFWVVGGRYADTRFTETVNGSEEERLGPFESYDDALVAWRGRAWATVDDAHARYRIEKL